MTTPSAKSPKVILSLEKYRVADFTTVAAGPLLGSILADFGAEVIKIESRVRIDAMRMGPENLERHPDKDPAFLHANRNKLGITLNFERPEAISLAKRLIAVSDVVVENFSPRVMPKWGLDYASLRKTKPDIIMVSLSACGQTGPLKDVVAYGPTLSSLSGIDSLVGYEGDRPHGTQGFYTDWNSPVHGALAVLMALWHREQTGVGQYIDAAQWQATVSCLPEAVMDYTMNGRTARPRGNSQPGFAPHNVYPCQEEDKWVSICLKTDVEWERLREAMSRTSWTDAPRFVNQLGRWKNRAEIDKAIAGWTVNHTHHDLTTLLQSHGVAAMAFLDSSERLFDPHLEDRQVYTEVIHPLMGDYIVGGIPWKLSKTPGQINRPSPLLGQHNSYVFGDILGLSPQEISHFEKEQIIY